MKGTIVFDFDGVIHKYSKGWSDGTIYDEPNKYVIDVIDKLRANGYIVDIVSSRCSTHEGAESIGNWLDKYGIEVDHILSSKPPALVYIDDRSICFDPKDTNLYDRIVEFETHQKIQNKYNKLNDLEVLGLLRMKTEYFRKLNSKLDETVKDPIVSLCILDEWCETVKKYLDK